MTVFLLSDFDGVIAPIAQMPTEIPWSLRETRQMSESHGAPHSFYIYPELLSRLKALETLGLVDPFWLTTWKGETDALNKMTGLDWPEAGVPDFITSGFSWKEQMVIDAYKTGVPIVWLEDEPTDAMHRWVLNVSDMDRLLFIQPYSHQGINPQQMESIEQFVRIHA